MPIVTRTKTNPLLMTAEQRKATALPQRTVTTRRQQIAMEAKKIVLPTELSQVSDNFSDFPILIHGEPRTGKTTLAMVEEGVLLLTFDPPDKSMAWLQMHMTDWRTFLLTLAALENAVKSGKYNYTRVVVDGVEIMSRYCQNYVEETELNVNHISDADWGKGFDRFNGEFAAAVDRLLALPGGCWFICHSEWKQVKTRRGGEVNKLCPLLKSKVEDQVVGKTFANFAYTYVGARRVLVVRGDESTGAGCKIKGHFFTPKGEAVYEIPMGNNEQEAWDNLLIAFHNKQVFTHVSVTPAIKPKVGLLVKRK